MLGKWNKSVILTYIGLTLSILGMLLVFQGVNLKYVFICLMFSGICDLFDGTVARKCKRTKEEKDFGIELDSLVDVVSFIVLPLIILESINNSIWSLPIYVLYAIFGVARLAYFNIKAPHNNKPVPYYEGLPVTMAAIVFPILFLLSYIVKNNVFITIYTLVTLIVGILFITKIKVPKPKLISSIILVLCAAITTCIYLFIV